MIISYACHDKHRPFVHANGKRIDLPIIASERAMTTIKDLVGKDVKVEGGRIFDRDFLDEEFDVLTDLVDRGHAKWLVEPNG